MPENQDGLTRRNFLKKAAAGAAVASGITGSLPAVFAAATKPKSSPGMKYRVLGRTKLKVSELSFGTIRTGNAEVIHRGLDLGINYIDTAPSYRRGNSEADLGKALKGRRDRVIVGTKWMTNGSVPAADLLKSLDTSLQRLGLDHVDLIQIHGAQDEAQVTNDEVWKAFTEARKAGKVRFNGFSTHSNQAGVILAAIESKRYDTVLCAHNAITGDLVAAAVSAAKKAGLGVIAMKSLQPVLFGQGSDEFQNFRGNAYQQAIQWVLANRNVATVIVDMPTFDELEQNYAAATGKASAVALKEFEQMIVLAAAGACRLCGACTKQCPSGVRVADVMRYLLYHDSYGNRERAMEEYGALPVAATAKACGACDGCRAVCPWGLPIKQRMERAHAVLA